MSSLPPPSEDPFRKSVKIRICPYEDCKVSQHFLPEIITSKEFKKGVYYNQK